MDYSSTKATYSGFIKDSFKTIANMATDYSILMETSMSDASSTTNQKITTESSSGTTQISITEPSSME